MPHDDRLLRHALELAQQASAFASPNPTVGCVLTTPQGEVLGEGAHWYDRRDHAEIAALKQAAEHGHSVAGATAYVTLEPCTVSGRTGPCAEALVQARIARCVIATADPNPLVHGKGIELLQRASIEVEVAEPASEIGTRARRLNDAFAFSIVRDRPFVTLKSALSVDGRLAPAQHEPGKPFWLTGEAARADVQRLRHEHDALLTGIGTVLADDPSLNDRTGLPRRRPLLRVVLDSSLRLPLRSQLVLSAQNDLLVLCSDDADRQRIRLLEQAGAEVLCLPSTEPKLVLQELHRRKLLSVLLEAGSAMNGAFLQEKLVDRVVLYFAELELGKDAVPFARNGTSPFDLQFRLSELKRSTFPRGSSEDIRLAGYLHDPWAGL